MGGGATIRVGPAHLGLAIYQDGIGLRGGEFLSTRRWEWPDLDYGGTGDAFIFLPSPDGPVYGDDSFVGWETLSHPIADSRVVAALRGKEYDARGVCPFVLIPETYPESVRKYPSYFFTQMDLVVAVGYGVRVGFNPGELLDFALGWVGIDIYGDDLESRALKYRKEKARQQAESQPAVE